MWEYPIFFREGTISEHPRVRRWMFPCFSSICKGVQVRISTSLGVYGSSTEWPQFYIEHLFIVLLVELIFIVGLVNLTTGQPAVGDMVGFKCRACRR